jgi:hypothetical protein
MDQRTRGMPLYLTVKCPHVDRCTIGQAYPRKVTIYIFGQQLGRVTFIDLDESPSDSGVSG